MRDEIQRLQTQLALLADLTDLCVEASIHAALSTLYFMADQLVLAHSHIQAAVKLKQDGKYINELLEL